MEGLYPLCKKNTDEHVEEFPTPSVAVAVILDVVFVLSVIAALKIPAPSAVVVAAGGPAQDPVL